MTKITKIEPKTYQGKVTGYKVELSDGTQGNLSEKESDKMLQVGDDVTVTVSDYVSKAGNHSNLITLKRASGTAPQTATTQSAQPSKPQPPAPVRVATNKSKDDHKAEASIKALEFVMDAFKAERIDQPKIKELQRECVEILWGEIDEIFAGK